MLNLLIQSQTHSMKSDKKVAKHKAWYVEFNKQESIAAEFCRVSTYSHKI